MVPLYKLDNMNDYDKLISTIQSRDHACLRSLVRTIDWNDPTLDEILPLHYAAQVADSEVLRILLSTRCSRFINTFDDISYTPMMYAAMRGAAEMVALLIESRADINACDVTHIGNTVLREVIEEAIPSLVAQLLAAGADPTIKGWMQLSAVDKAIERYESQGSSEAAEILHLVKANTGKPIG